MLVRSRVTQFCCVLFWSSTGDRWKRAPCGRADSIATFSPSTSWLLRKLGKVRPYDLMKWMTRSDGGQAWIGGVAGLSAWFRATMAPRLQHLPAALEGGCSDHHCSNTSLFSWWRAGLLALATLILLPLNCILIFTGTDCIFVFIR